MRRASTRRSAAKLSACPIKVTWPRSNQCHATTRSCAWQLRSREVSHYPSSTPSSVSSQSVTRWRRSGANLTWLPVVCPGDRVRCGPPAVVNNQNTDGGLVSSRSRYQDASRREVAIEYVGDMRYSSSTTVGGRQRWYDPAPCVIDDVRWQRSCRIARPRVDAEERGSARAGDHRERSRKNQCNSHARTHSAVSVLATSSPLSARRCNLYYLRVYLRVVKGDTPFAASPRRDRITMLKWFVWTIDIVCYARCSFILFIDSVEKRRHHHGLQHVVLFKHRD